METCKIEFYFKRADVEKLLKDNPSAKGIIISEEIVPDTSSGSRQGNMVYITARADGNAGAMPPSGISTMLESSGGVAGCPYPPGCPK